MEWGSNLYGDFWVCPLFNKPAEGRMEFVCIHAWRNLVLETPATEGRTRIVQRIAARPSPAWPED
jgi:hypothetical protein